MASCVPTALTASVTGEVGGAGGGHETVELTNSSAQACSMYGFPGLGLLDGGGSPLPLGVQRVHGAQGDEPAVAEITVDLNPGTTASFWIEWSTGDGSATGTLEITPPNQTTQILIPDPGIPLNVGAVFVSAVSSGVIDAASPLPVPEMPIDGPYADLFWNPVPARPYTALQIPMAVVQVPSAAASQTPAAYFWSTEFSPAGSCGCANGDGGYFGLQDDNNGERAIFSWWSALRASSTNPAAVIANFTGEGTGVQIKLPYEIVPGRVYQLRVARTEVGPSATTWEAVIADTATATTTVVGAIVVPDAWGKSLAASTTSFTEYYGTPVTNCSQLPATTAQFGPVALNGALPSSGPNFHYGQVGQGCSTMESATGPGTFDQQVGSAA
ncbi:MAG: DUF4232 domain-containing protein [Acidimicrobiales bacterium]